MGGVEKLKLKLTSASTRVGVEARAELGNIQLKDACDLHLRLLLSSFKVS